MHTRTYQHFLTMITKIETKCEVKTAKELRLSLQEEIKITPREKFNCPHMYYCIAFKLYLVKLDYWSLYGYVIWTFSKQLVQMYSGGSCDRWHWCMHQLTAGALLCSLYILTFDL